jgi:orotidine-5'-phosphate decarboxylase
MNFTNQLETSIKDKDSLLCVGIDPIIEKVPGGVKGLLDFCRQYIDKTVKHAAVFKPQAAYFAALE